MMMYNHLALAAAGAWSASVLAPQYTVNVSAVYWPIVMASALLPDLDTRHSYLGRRLPFISVPLGLLVGHRTLTHSIWPVLILIALSVLLGLPWVGWIAFGIALHLFGDFVTNSGLPLFWPFTKRFSSGITVQTGGVLEFAMAYILVGCIYVATTWLTGGVLVWS